MKTFRKLGLLGLLCTSFLFSFSQKNGLRNLQLFQGNGIDAFISIIKAQDGYLAVGKSSSDATTLPGAHGDYEGLLVKFDATMKPVWKKGLGGTGNDRLMGGLSLSGGGYIVWGFTESDNGDVTRPAGKDRDAWVLRLDEAGNIVWQKSFGGSGMDYASAGVRSGANEFLIMGHTASVDGDVSGKSTTDIDVWLLRIDGDGHLLEQKIYGGTQHEGALLLPEHFVTEKTTLVSTHEGGFAFISTTLSNDGDVSGNKGNRDMWVVKLDNSLQIQWQKCIGGTAEEAGYGLHQLVDSSFIISGYAYSNSGDIPGVYNGSNRSSVVGRLSAQGEKLWVRTFGNGIFYNACSDAEGNFTIAGFGGLNQAINYGMQNGGSTLLKMNKEGEVIWYRHVGGNGGGNDYDYLFDVIPGPEDTYITAGMTNARTADLTGYTPWYDALLVQTKGLSTLKGQVFIDSNNNKIKDAGEGYPYNFSLGSRHLYGMINYQSWNVYFLAPPYNNFDDGRFLIAQDTGTFRLMWGHDASLYYSTPTSFQMYRFTAPGQQDSITIRLVPKSLVKDLGAAIEGPDIMDLNTEIKFNVIVSNYGGDSVVNGSLKIVKDRRTRFVDPISTPIQDTLTVFLPAIAPLSMDTISVSIHAAERDPLKVGDTLRIQALVQHSNDFDSTNNHALKLTTIAGVYTQPDTTKTTLEAPAGIQWIRFMQGKGSDHANGVTALKDGGFAICGITYSKDGDFKTAADSMGNAFVSVFNPDGSSRWTRVFKGDRYETFQSIKELADGSLLVAGSTQSGNGDFEGNFASSTITLFRLNKDGSTRWSRLMGETGANSLYNMHTTPDGGALLSFQLTKTVNNKQNWLYKIDSTGVIQWKKPLTGTLQQFDAAPGPNGNIIAAGLDTVSVRGDAYRIFKFDANGTTLWEKTFRLFESTPTYFYFVNRVHIAADSSIYLLGDGHYLPQDSIKGKKTGLHQKEDFALIKLDKEGNKLWQRYYGGNNRDMPSSLATTSDGGFLISGYTLSNDGNISNFKGIKDGWLLKVDAAGRVVWQRTIGGQWDDGLNDVVSAGDNTIYAVGYSSSFNSGDIQKNNASADVMIVKIGIANFVEGSVFFDANNNGIKDAAERWLNHLPVSSDKGETGNATMTRDGYFTISADTGRYITKPLLDANFKTTPLADTVTFHTYNNRHFIQFAVQPKELKKDLRVDLLPLGPVRPGFESGYKIVYRNAGSVSMQLDTVVLIKDKMQTLVQATPQYTFLKGDTLTWIIPRIEPLDTAGTIFITLRNAAPPTLNNGEKVTLQATIAPIAGDATPEDNLSQLVQTVQGSFDPNDKTEKHNGRITQKELNSGAYLTYLIRFQNTGTDTAFTVVVRDTLDKRLDWSTFEMIDASHAYSLAIAGKNKLAWTFSQINLPDSNVNEKASHGHIAYRIRPVAGLNIGDSIINTASIYFDFNLPVVTNRQNTTVSVEVLNANPNPPEAEKNIRLFPNPTKDILWVQVQRQLNTQVEVAVYNSTGHKVWQKNYGKITAGQWDAQLNFKGYASGVYMVIVTLGDKTHTYKVQVQ